MNKVKSVEELEVFKRAHQLTLRVYRLSESFPSEERFGLVSQTRRAAASICTNLLEGSHRLGRPEYRHFVGIAKGSSGELKYHFLLSKDLGFLSDGDYSVLEAEVEEISKMLNGLARSLSSNH